MALQDQVNVRKSQLCCDSKVGDKGGVGSRDFSKLNLKDTALKRPESQKVSLPYFFFFRFLTLNNKTLKSFEWRRKRHNYVWTEIVTGPHVPRDTPAAAPIKSLSFMLVISKFAFYRTFSFSFHPKYFWDVDHDDFIQAGHVIAPSSNELQRVYFVVSKIQLVVYHQCCVMIGWATTRLYVIAH